MKITKYLKSDRIFCDCGGALEGYGWWLSCCKCGKRYPLQSYEITPSTQKGLGEE